LGDTQKYAGKSTTSISQERLLRVITKNGANQFADAVQAHSPTNCLI
jgi:hypothetical protein